MRGSGFFSSSWRRSWEECCDEKKPDPFVLKNRGGFSTSMGPPYPGCALKNPGGISTVGSGQWAVNRAEEGRGRARARKAVGVAPETELDSSAPGGRFASG